MVLVIDNYDSFTYNLVQYLLELGEEVIVHRNDEISLDRIREANPQQIVISPGPCTPNEAGISVNCIKEFGSSIPILGVCLGHQSIAQAFGGKIVRANQVMHGNKSRVCSMLKFSLEIIFSRAEEISILLFIPSF